MIAYSFHPDADAELEEAAVFYETRMAGLGKSFAAEVIVARFSHSVVYRQVADAIVVIAVAHQRRRPGYWRRRK